MAEELPGLKIEISAGPPKPKPPPIQAVRDGGPSLIGRLRCWFRRKRGLRHLYRKEPWCVLCGHVRKSRKS